jgi:hypothetical protein
MTQAQETAGELPWKASPDDEISANSAIGSLREALLMWLKTERGHHIETTLVAIGALTGFAAQTAVRERLAKRDIPMPNATTATPEALSEYLRKKGLFVTVTTQSGETLYFGDLINGYLVHGANSKYRFALWNVVAASALAAGVTQADLPDTGVMFRQIAGTVGQPEFGIPTAAKEYQPELTPRQALNLFWPRAKLILARTDGPGPATGRGVAPEHWPLICVIVANQLVRATRDMLDPPIGLGLLMESAIAMSKVDPKSVPQTLPPS